MTEPASSRASAAHLHGRGRYWAAAIALLGLCLAAACWFPLSTILGLPSRDYNEGWNAYRQWMAFSGQKLYGAHPLLWTTNYPPLSFHLVALLGGAKANMVPAGRALCAVSVILSSLLAGLITRLVTGSRAGAVFAGLWLPTALAGFDPSRLAVDDPEMLAIAFGIFGLFAYLRSAQRTAWLAIAAAAFTACLFVKLDPIAFPLSVALHLLATRNWRGLALFACTGLALAAGALALSLHLDGRHMLADILQPRAYALAHLAAKTWRYLQHFFVIIAIGCAGLRYGRTIPFRGFLAVLLVCANLAAICFAGGDGVGANIFLPALVADLLACIAAICWLRRQSGPWFPVAVTATGLAAAVFIPAQIRQDITASRNLPAATADARQAIAGLRSARGPVICEDMLLCYDADKALAYDPYYVNDQIRLGHIPASSIVAQLRARHYGAIQLDGPAFGPWPGRLNERFTPAIQRALLASYRPVFASFRDVVFLPR